jgi:methylenetetrahydrofolate--tRNA-(uracil-5-)-methyltransferase
LGALLAHITGGANAETYQPMNINFGLMPPLYGPKTKKADRKKRYTDRARQALARWIETDGASERIAETVDDANVPAGN